MDKKTTIRGRIIRIVDQHTALVNLGRVDRIVLESIFRVIGESEEITDPITDKKLGSIDVVKAKLKASQVYERFTVATSRWTTYSLSVRPSISIEEIVKSMYNTESESHGEDLHVDPKEIRPWKVHAEQLIRVGDEVEVEIRVEADEKTTYSKPDGTTN
jgi:hypothetical protein